MKLNFVCFSEYLWPPKDPCGKRRRSGAFFFSKKKTTEEVKRRMFYRFSEINFFRKLLPEKVSCWLLLPLKKTMFPFPSFVRVFVQNMDRYLRDIAMDSRFTKNFELSICSNSSIDN